MKSSILLSVISVVALMGCAQSSVIPISGDTIQITTSAAPACGGIGAQKVAIRRAAIETINRGYDRFIVLGANAQNNVGVVGYTPIQANTYGSAQAYGYGNTVNVYGQSTTTYSGGQPIISGSHDQGLVVKMFKNGDRRGANAVSARGSLGEDWKEAIKRKTDVSCL